MSNKKVIAERLLQVGAVKLSTEKPFTWSSGWKSPIYCDNRKVLSFPHIRDFVKSELCDVIFSKFPDAECLAGVATAGIAWGAMAADQLKLPYVYVRPKPKEHGLGNQIEGHYTQGEKVVVVEDLVSTAKSSLQVVQALRDAGMEVIAVVALFSYGFPVAKNSFGSAGVDFEPLSDYETLLGIGIEKGFIAKELEPHLKKWSENPETWEGL